MTNPKLALAFLALAHLTCASVPLTAPADTTMQVFANPEFIVANGGVSVISAVLVEPAGTLVPDGTVVQFFTNLGRIDNQAKTKDGVARANLVADSRSGTANVTAVSGAVTEPAEPIIIGSARPATILVTANPPRVTDPRNSEITANVFDESGNPVANVPVIFSVTVVTAGRLLQESFDSGGQPRFTDTNGQARDTLRTSQNRADPVKVVRVTASLPVPPGDGTVDVQIN